MMMEQLDLLSYTPPAQVTSRAETMKNARARAEVGIARSADRNEGANAGWCGMAVEHLRRFVSNQHGLFTIEQARGVIAAELPAPTDGRAWGAVTRQAVALRYIEKTKLTAPAASSNASPKPLWKKGGGA